MALDAARATLGAEAVAASMDECAHEADVLIITTPWPLFSTLDPEAISKFGRPAVIIDCWRVLPKDRFKSVAKILYIGAGDEQQPRSKMSRT